MNTSVIQEGIVPSTGNNKGTHIKIFIQYGKNVVSDCFIPDKLVTECMSVNDCYVTAKFFQVEQNSVHANKS